MFSHIEKKRADKNKNNQLGCAVANVMFDGAAAAGSIAFHFRRDFDDTWKSSSTPRPTMSGWGDTAPKKGAATIFKKPPCPPLSLPRCARDRARGRPMEPKQPTPAVRKVDQGKWSDLSPRVYMRNPKTEGCACIPP